MWGAGLRIAVLFRLIGKTAVIACRCCLGAPPQMVINLKIRILRLLIPVVKCRAMDCDERFSKC